MNGKVEQRPMNNILVLPFSQSWPHKVRGVCWQKICPIDEWSIASHRGSIPRDQHCVWLGEAWAQVQWKTKRLQNHQGGSIYWTPSLLICFQMLVAQNEVSDKNEESIGLKSFSDVSIFFIKHHEITQRIYPLSRKFWLVILSCSCYKIKRIKCYIKITPSKFAFSSQPFA